MQAKRPVNQARLKTKMVHARPIHAVDVSILGAESLPGHERVVDGDLQAPILCPVASTNRTCHTTYYVVRASHDQRTVRGIGTHAGTGNRSFGLRPRRSRKPAAGPSPGPPTGSMSTLVPDVWVYMGLNSLVLQKSSQKNATLVHELWPGRGQPIIDSNAYGRAANCSTGIRAWAVVLAGTDLQLQRRRSAPQLAPRYVGVKLSQLDRVSMHVVDRDIPHRTRNVDCTSCFQNGQPLCCKSTTVVAQAESVRCL